MPQEERKMEQFAEGESTRKEIKNKLRQNFDGKIVRKDLTKKIKYVYRYRPAHDP